MKILKCLLMIVTAPVILVLTLFVWLCTGLIYISGLVLGLLSTIADLDKAKEDIAINIASANAYWWGISRPVKIGMLVLTDILVPWLLVLTYTVE